MTFLTLLSLVLCFAPPAVKSPAPKGDGSATVVTQEIPPTAGAFRVTIQTAPKLTDDALWSWDYPDDPAITPVSETANELVLEVPLTPQREFTVKWTAKEPKQKQVVLRTKVKAGKGPQPPPVPPGPTPIPPDPNKPSPFAAPGLRVMFLYRDMDTGRYSPEQRQMILSQDFRDYLNRVVADDPNCADGKGYMMLKVGANMVGAPDLWKNAAAIPATVPTDAPWLRVGNGTTGYDGPAPKTIAELKTILKSLGAAE